MISFLDFKRGAKSILEKSIFDSLFSKNVDSKIVSELDNPVTAIKAMSAAVVDAGNTASKFNPSQMNVGDTSLVMMGDGKDTESNFIISFSKMAELSDGSGLFQISGTSNKGMLKALTGSEDQKDLLRDSILAIIPQKGIEKEKNATIKILKNVLPNGDDYTTETVMIGSVSSSDFLEKISKL